MGPFGTGGNEDAYSAERIGLAREALYRRQIFVYQGDLYAGKLQAHRGVGLRSPHPGRPGSAPPGPIRKSGAGLGGKRRVGRAGERAFGKN